MKTQITLKDLIRELNKYKKECGDSLVYFSASDLNNLVSINNLSVGFTTKLTSGCFIKQEDVLTPKEFENQGVKDNYDKIVVLGNYIKTN